MKLDFEISLSTGCCDQLEFCDTSGDYNPNNPKSCDGYSLVDDSNVTNQVFRSDVFSTCFNWIMPDGTKFTSIDLLFLPAQYASIDFTLSGGVAGDWIVSSLEGVSLGSAIFLTTISQLVYDLVNSINLNSEITGWYAYYSGLTITLYRLDSGSEFNGDVLTTIFNIGTTLAVATTGITSGGNDSDDCKTFRITDLYGRFNCPEGVSCWPDGVYTITYIIKNNLGFEITRTTKKFFLDCNVHKCIYNQIKTLCCDGCSCDDDKWIKVLNLKMRLEALNDAYNEQNYICANEGVVELLDDCKNLCLDC